jgi:hypothetical protein
MDGNKDKTPQSSKNWYYKKAKIIVKNMYLKFTEKISFSPRIELTDTVSIATATNKFMPQGVGPEWLHKKAASRLLKFVLYFIKNEFDRLKIF